MQKLDSICAINHPSFNTQYSYLPYLAAALAAAADVAEMMASQVEVAPAHMPSHHDLEPVNSIIIYTLQI